MLVPPRQIIVQGMTEIVTACIQAFTECGTIPQYVNTFYQTDCQQSCLIGIDSVILLKKYASLMMDEDREIANFYLKAVIHIIQHENLTKAETIIRALVAVAYSASRADFSDETRATSDIYRELIEKLFDDNDVILFNIENLFEFSEEESSLLEKLKITSGEERNYWSDWAIDLKKEALEDIEESPGTLPSRWYMPRIGDELLQDLKVLSLWRQNVRSEVWRSSTTRVMMQIEKMKECVEVEHQFYRNICVAHGGEPIQLPSSYYTKVTLDCCTMHWESCTQQQKNIKISSNKYNIVQLN